MREMVENRRHRAPHLEAEDYAEKLAAPKPRSGLTGTGAVATLSYGPLVPNNLSLYRARDNFPYVHGFDFIEVPDGGFENLRIPEGEIVRAEYFYYLAPPLDEGGAVWAAAIPASSGEASEAGQTQGGLPGGAGAGGGSSAGRVRFGTLLKLGG